MWHRLNITAAVCLLLLPAVVGAADNGLFFGAGLSSRFMDGDGWYSLTLDPAITYDYPVDPSAEPYTIVGYFNVTDRYGYFLNSRNLFGFTPLVGYRFNRRFSVTLSFDYLLSEDGQRVRTSARYKTDSDDPIVYDDSRLTQRVLSAAGQFYPGLGGAFITAGIEYDYLKIEIYTEPNDQVRMENFTYESSDNALGWFIGIGLERPIRPKITLVGMTTYSFTDYDGDKLFFGERADDFKLDVGGFNAHLGFRYYLH